MKRPRRRRHGMALGTVVALFALSALTAATAIPAVAAVEPPQQPTRELVERSRELMRAYDYEGALQAAEQAVAAAPFDIGANEVLQSALARVGAQRDLVGRYRQLLERYPNSAAANYLLSTAVRDRDAAQAYLQEALRLDPDFGPAVRAMASRTSRRGGSDEALEWARRAMELMPGDYSAVNTYVRELRRHDRDQEALSVLRQMTYMYPNELRYWTALWRAELQAMGRRERSLGPLLTEIHAQRFRFMGSMADMEQLAGLLRAGGAEGRDMATDLWLEIAERYPEHPRAQVALLAAAGAATDPDREMEILARLLTLYPDSPAVYRAHEEMIQSLIRRDLFDEAIEVAKSLVELPDDGLEESGAGRDRAVNDTDWGRSLVCIGHLGWFDAAVSRAEAAQAPELSRTLDSVRALSEEMTASRATTEEVTIVVADGDARIVRTSTRTRRPRPVTPEAAAAAQSLLASECTERDPLLSVARRLTAAETYAVLGIQLTEKAAALQPLTGPTGEAAVGRQRQEAESTRNTLAGLYLDAGRVGEALRIVDEVVAGAEVSSLRWDTVRTAARAYEAAGSTERAKAYYLWAMSSNRRGREVEEALARLYASTSSVELQRFSPDEAPGIVAASIDLSPPEAGAGSPLERYLERDLTLIYFWSPHFAPSRENLPVLGPLEDMYPDGDFATLAVAVSRSAESAARSIRRNPGPGAAAAADLGVLAAFSVDELPTALLVDATGRVLARQMSFGIDPETWALGWLEVIDEELERRRQVP